MAGWTNYTEQKVLEHFLRGTIYTPAPVIYAALLRAEPGEDGTGGNEPTGLAGYARQAVTFGSYVTRQISNDVTLTWSAGVDWGLCTHLGLFDALTSGNMLASTLLPTPPGPGIIPSPTITSGTSFSLAAGEIVVVQNFVGPFLAQRILELVLKNTAHATLASRKAHLFTVAPTNDGGGTVLVAGDYAPQTAAFATYSSVSKCLLSSDITFRGATGGAWGALKAWALFDGTNPASDHQLFWSPITPEPNVGAAAPFSLLASATFCGLE